ncbi:MAG: carbon-nitrogen hydrolase family protein, partial [Thermoplasmata archaeon]
MRLVLGQLAPVPAEPGRNLERIAEAVRAAPADLAVFPELFVSGYRLGDRFHTLALTPGGTDPSSEALRQIARKSGTPIVVGAPVGSGERRGEIHNAAVLVLPTGELHLQVKRYLPNFGPFEEGLAFSPTNASRPFDVAGHRVGLEICYDVFFPEVARDLALAGA